MFEYPLTNIYKQLWNKKVQATLMFSIPAEDDALPVLYEILDVLQNLNAKKIQEVLEQDLREYFFNEVFPQVCSKIIKSRYFKNQIVLSISNKILANSLYLYTRYLDLVSKYTGLGQILTILLASDQYYFKTNNQLDYKLYPHYYFDNLSNLEFTNTLAQDDLVDIIKSNGKYDKLIWTRGKVLLVNQSYIQVEYLNDVEERTVTMDKHSFQIAPYLSKSKDFQWRMNLKVGDVIDCQDSFGGWYHGTIINVVQHGDNKKSVTITYKVYDQNGNKKDQSGKFYGFTDQQETIDVTVPKIMPFCSTCKYRNYEISKSSFQTDDSNDMVFEQIGGQKIYAFPRKRALSQFYFRELNTFGRMGGFDKPVQKMFSQINFHLLCNYVKGIGGVCQYLHKQIVVQLVQKIKVLVQKHIFATSDIVAKQFTKQRSEALFSGLKNLMKRLCSTQQVQKYENTLKMKLVSQCLESQALKRKLQGLHELKDMVRGMSHSSQKNKVIKNWIIEEKIFDKIYIQNSHVQLIKKSEDFFKFLINEDILQVKDLQRLYKIAQKGDYESRVSLYKLFQQMSHVFNKSHVDFLIDTILESELNLVLNQDIDMLHELSRFSNYFPKQKVKVFFEKLILNDSKNKQLNDYAIKKYSEIVARGYEMKSYRRQIIKNFVAKLNTNDYEKVIKLLKGIFQGISVGEWGKKDLTEILEDEKIEEIIVKSIKQGHQRSDYKKLAHEMLNFELFLVKLNHRIKIKLSTLRQIWQSLKNWPQNRAEYYQWLNKIMQCDQGIEADQQDNHGLQQFYAQIFSKEYSIELTAQQFTLAKSIFVQINKKSKLLTVCNVIKDKQIQKQYKRRCQMKTLKLLDKIQSIIYECKRQISESAFKFYLQLYSSKQNSAEQITEALESLLQKLKDFYGTKQLHKIERTINLIEMVINDSEKFHQLNVISMIKCRKGSLINVTVINDVSYMSDSIRKQNLYEKSNISLLQLKIKISAKVNVSVEELKVIGKFELSDYFNSYTLAELNINAEDPLTVSRRSVSSAPEQELILQGKLNPKAVKVFKSIFQKYSTDQHMSKEDYNKFTAACLGTYSKNYHDKIGPIYSKYDSDHDGMLTFQDFLKFYTDSALDKPSTVWNNLKNLNVRGNFKFKDQIQQMLPQQVLPRHTLYKKEQIYDILFDLLEEKQISKTVYKFLLRLPANKTMNQEVRNIWAESGSDKGKQNLQKFLTEKSKFRLMYKLILILNILGYTETNDSIWNVKFAINHGYEIPFKFLKKIVETKELYSSIDLDIIELIFQIVKDYIYNSFGTKQSLQSSSLFQQQCSIDEKMQCLLTGVYPKTYSSFRRDYSISFKYEWKDDKQVFISLFLNMLIKMKTQLSNEKEPQRKAVFTAMSFKLMAVLSCLMINQHQKALLSLYPIFFDEKQSAKTLNEFYMMIMCVCIYSRDSQQHIHIHELFKFIKSKHITSQHFRVLALLVSKFGFKEQNVSQIPEVLLKNILQEQNQPTIEGCARLLCNFQVGQLSTITPKDVQDIFDKCLFGKNITCRKQQSRNQIYEFLIKISEVNEQIAQQVVQKTKNVILENMPLMKVVYSSEVNKRSTYGYAGLKNLGNICYMNSMIQQLYTNKVFRYLLLRVDDKKQQEITFDAKGQKVDDNLLHQIQRIFGYLQKTSRQDFSPSSFCIAYKPFGQSVNIMMQQDVQQFVSMFFDRLEEGIKQHPLRNLIQNFYTGKTANLFKCHNCQKTKKIQENFHSISLEVKASKNLSESFNRYALGQVINEYRCDFCAQKADVSKMTRISKPPQMLIIHLQRIVFNLDTFINQKITTKHEFPMDLNIYNFTLENFQKEQSSQQHNADLTPYDYELTGIITHIGNAESGHYISYIKTEQNKWLQFNDSIISHFSVNSIDAQCFGGMSSAFEDDFQWEKKQSSKSAYLLIYNRKLDPTIQLVIHGKQLTKKQRILAELNLQQEPQVLNQNSNQQKQSEPTESQQQTGSAFEDSQKQKQRRQFKDDEDMREIQIIKQKKSDDNIGQKIDKAFQKDLVSDQLIVKVKNNITPFYPSTLEQQIQIDNKVHFFQTSLASEGFSVFFAKLISIPQLYSQQLIQMCQKLTFSFWLKSKSFKQLLQALQIYLKTHPENVNELVLRNDQFFYLLIENSSVDIRVHVAYFLAHVISNYAQCSQQKDGYLTKQSVEGQNIFQFLDRLFDLIPTNVTKCWTKFNQYFEFWYFMSDKKIFAKYFVQKQILKHFVDYFLDKKSPLKIYTNKKVQEIGSSYANPDFSMLLRCVSNLLTFYFTEQNEFSLTEEDLKVLVYFQFLQKLISQCHQQIAARMAKQICPRNLKASQKFAVVLLKGFSKSTYQNVQKYIEVMKEYILIEDQHQQLRMGWVLGKQTLNVSTITKTMNALNSKGFEERLFYYESSLIVEQGASFLQPIYQLNKRVENFCILCVQGVIKICFQSKPVRDYVFALGAPTLMYARYIDFYDQFIDRYIQESRKSFYSTVTYFNKTQLGQQVKDAYVQLLQLRKDEQMTQQNQKPQQTDINNFQKQPQAPSAPQVKAPQTQVQVECNQQKERSSETNIKYVQANQQGGQERQESIGKKQNQAENQTEHVGNNQTENVGKNQTEEEGKNQTENIIVEHTILDKFQNYDYQNQNDAYDTKQQAENLKEFAKIQFLDGSFSNDKKASQDQENDLVINSASKPDQQQQPNTLNTQSNIIEWEEVNIQEEETTKHSDLQSLLDDPRNYEMDNQPAIFENIKNFHKQDPGYYNQDAQSNKNNSRKSLVQGNDSRDDDFNGIQMKEISTILNKQNTLQLNQIQPYKDISEGFEQNEKKSSDWSHESFGDQINSPPRNLVGKTRKSKRNKVGLKIHSNKRIFDSTVMNDSDLEYSDADENEPFIKHQKSDDKENTDEKMIEKQKEPTNLNTEQFKLAYQPVQFIYKPVESITVDKELTGIEVIYHQSQVNYVKTKPTGKGNKAFGGTYGSGKLFNRIKQECWQEKRTQLMKGYLISNHSRTYLRIQNLYGCQLIKPNETGWVWGQIILKIWKCERSTDWPEWSMYQ